IQNLNDSGQFQLESITALGVALQQDVQALNAAKARLGSCATETAAVTPDPIEGSWIFVSQLGDCDGILVISGTGQAPINIIRTGPNTFGASSIPDAITKLGPGRYIRRPSKASYDPVTRFKSDFADDVYNLNG